MPVQRAQKRRPAFARAAGFKVLKRRRGKNAAMKEFTRGGKEQDGLDELIILTDQLFPP